MHIGRFVSSGINEETQHNIFIWAESRDFYFSFFLVTWKHHHRQKYLHENFSHFLIPLHGVFSVALRVTTSSYNSSSVTRMPTRLRKCLLLNRRSSNVVNWEMKIWCNHCNPLSVFLPLVSYHSNSFSRVIFRAVDWPFTLNVSITPLSWAIHAGYSKRAADGAYCWAHLKGQQGILRNSRSSQRAICRQGKHSVFDYFPQVPSKSVGHLRLQSSR